MYSDRKRKATVKWLTSSIKLGFSYCQKNCRPGYYPIYTGHSRCCWVCKFCENKYFKTAEGRDGCAKCDEETSLTNENRTMHIPFTYQYYQIEGNNTNIVFFSFFFFCSYRKLVFINYFICLCKVPKNTCSKII